MRLILAAVLCSTTAALALDIGHTRLPEKLRIASESAELMLNGAGLRTRFLIEVYVIGLYLPERKSVDAEVLAHAGVKRVRIVMLRDISAKQMTESLLSVMQKNNGKAELDAVQEGIAEFQSMLLALGQVPKGTTFDIDYSPRSGTRFAVNAIPKGKPVAGPAFYRAVLRIWIGDKPEQPGLKQALLGR